MTFHRDTVTDVVRFDGIHKVIENVYGVTKSKIHSDVNIYTFSHKVTHYTMGKISADVVSAVSAGEVSCPVDYFALAHALQDARKDAPETFENLATAYARASHLANAELGAEVDETLMGDAERDLLLATDAAYDLVQATLEKKDYQALIAALAALREPIDRFFEDVMVMDEDSALRENRLRLLNRFEAVFAGVANIGALAKK